MEEEYKLPFEKLEVWHLAKDFVKKIYLTTKQFPKTEQFGLTNQISRAAISIPSNLAEGSARTSRKDQAHFSQLAYSSLMEVACQLQIAQEMNFLSPDEYANLRKEILRLSVKINALRRSQLKDFT